MDAGSFVAHGDRARMRTRQSIAIKNLRDSIAGGVATFRGSDNDEIDDLVCKVLKTIDDEAEKADRSSIIVSTRMATDPRIPSERVTEQQLREQRELRTSTFWTLFLAIPIIFTHGVATRMQFMYGSLYGRKGLNLNNAYAILAVGFTAMGRATAPPLLRRYFENPYVFMFLNATTLIGCSLMFAVPYVGGRDNFDEKGLGLFEGEEPASAGTVCFFYFTMYIQGLAEVLSGWDMLMKFEMRMWTPDRQQLAFRISFVSIALGSATAFAGSSWLFEYYGLHGCAYLGIAMGGFNVIFPGIYLTTRWKAFAHWRQGGDKKRSVASRRSQPLMRMIKLDDLDEESEEHKSTTQLQFVPNDSKRSVQTSQHSTTSSRAGSRDSAILPTTEKVSTERVSEYVEPRNYFEFQKQLQHQTSERLVNNFQILKSQTKGFLKEQMNNLKNTDIVTAFDPNLLLTHSKHIKWPKDFKKQIVVMRWFCILALALGSAMISSQFAVYVLYLVDVWDVPVVFAGTSMAVGEISGMLTLLISIYFGNRKTKESETKESEEAEEDSDFMGTLRVSPVEDMEKLSKMGTWRKLYRNPSALFEVPAMFVVCCLLAVIPLSLLGWLKPPNYVPGEEEDAEPLMADVSWSTRLIVALCSGVGIGIVNCVMHATTIEMAALLLPEDLFEKSVAWGYSFRRITNLFVCLLATGLYSISRFLVYQVIAFVYLLAVPASIYVLGHYMKCMPWQKREVVFEKYMETKLAMDSMDNDDDDGMISANDSSSSINYSSSAKHRNSANLWLGEIEEVDSEEEDSGDIQNVEEKSSDLDDGSNQTSPSSKEEL